jgi:Holliday junction resolvasome RuvABC endonuclease subunit
MHPSRHHRRILAIDPGTRLMGYAVLDGSRLVASGVYRLQRRRRARETLEDAERWLAGLISRYRPQVLVIERPFTAFGRRTSLLQVLAQEIEALAASRGLAVRALAPTLVRRVLLGNGHATKDDVMRHLIRRHYPQLAALAASRTARRKRYWQNMFDAIAVGVAFRMLQRARPAPSASRSPATTGAP